MDISLNMFGTHANATFQNFDHKSTSLNQRGFLDYSQFINERQKQSVTSIIADIGFYYNNLKSNITCNKLKSTRFEPSITFFNGTRFYNSGINYTEFFYGANVDYSSIINDGKKVKTTYINPKVGIMIGTGRIEPAAELFNAMFIVGDLNERDFNLDFDQKVMFEFGRLLAEQRQMRLLDGRRQYV